MTAGEIYRWPDGTIFRVCCVRGDEADGQILWAGATSWAPYGTTHTVETLASAVALSGTEQR